MKAINKNTRSRVNNPETNVLLLLVDRLGTRCERIDYDTRSRVARYHAERVQISYRQIKEGKNRDSGRR